MTDQQKEIREVLINMKLEALEMVSISAVSYKWCLFDRKGTVGLSVACGPLLTFWTNF